VTRTQPVCSNHLFPEHESRFVRKTHKDDLQWCNQICDCCRYGKYSLLSDLPSSSPLQSVQAVRTGVLTCRRAYSQILHLWILVLSMVTGPLNRSAPSIEPVLHLNPRFPIVIISAMPLRKPIVTGSTQGTIYGQI